MDIDRGLLGAIVREGLGGFYDNGLTVEMIDGAATVAFRYVDNYFREFGKIPSHEVVYQETGVDVFTVPKEPLAFWAKEIKRRHLYDNMRLGLADALDKLEKRDSEAALADIESLVFKLRNSVPALQKTVSIFSNPDEIFEDYERSKMGVTGVPLPWPTGNALTSGWQPEDLVVIAARMGVGKTFLLLIIAKWAWESQKRVLLASTEMSRKSLRKRVAALTTKTSYGRLRHGNLTSMEEELFKKRLGMLSDDKNFLMMGDGFSVTLESIEAAIIEFKPDLVCIDGIYLLKSSNAKGKDKFSRVGEIFDMTKDMAKRNKVPVVVTSQLNRENKNKFGSQKVSFDMDRLAFSDNIGMVADCVFFLKQTKEMRDAREMEIQPGKLREGDSMKNILINWNFEAQDFTEKNVNVQDEVEKAVAKIEIPEDAAF